MGPACHHDLQPYSLFIGWHCEGRAVATNGYACYISLLPDVFFMPLLHWEYAASTLFRFYILYL